MRHRMLFGSVVALGLLVAWHSSPGDDTPAEPDIFANKMLYIVTTPKDPKSDSGYGIYEKAKVLKLGDRPFLVGVVPAYNADPQYKAAAGKKVWTPVSEIVQMTEFATLEDAKAFFESGRTDKVDQ